MPLAGLQRAFAALATSQEERDRLAGDPRGFAAAFALGPAEMDALGELGVERLHVYATGLERKRSREAARLLPAAAAILGAAFDRAFVAYARRVPLGTGPLRYRDDVLAFARGSVHPLVAFEAARLRVRSRPPHVGFGVYRCDVRASLARREAVAGQTIAVWLPFGSAPVLFRVRSGTGGAASISNKKPCRLPPETPRPKSPPT